MSNSSSTIVAQSKVAGMDNVTLYRNHTYSYAVLYGKSFHGYASLEVARAAYRECVENQELAAGWEPREDSI